MLVRVQVQVLFGLRYGRVAPICCGNNRRMKTLLPSNLAGRPLQWFVRSHSHGKVIRARDRGWQVLRSSLYSCTWTFYSAGILKACLPVQGRLLERGRQLNRKVDKIEKEPLMHTSRWPEAIKPFLRHLLALGS